MTSLSLFSIIMTPSLKLQHADHLIEWFTVLLLGLSYAQKIGNLTFFAKSALELACVILKIRH